MKLKHINESVLPISANEETEVVAATDVTMADEIASHEEDKQAIKDELKQVDTQTAELAKETCPEEHPAKVLESIEEDVVLEGDFDRLVTMMKSIRDIITCSNDDFIKAARIACRNK